jgi:hypothetical protein
MPAVRAIGQTAADGRRRLPKICAEAMWSEPGRSIGLYQSAASRTVVGVITSWCFARSVSLHPNAR